jgi:hypothetical protein
MVAQLLPHWKVAEQAGLVADASLTGVGGLLDRGIVGGARSAAVAAFTHIVALVVAVLVARADRLTIEGFVGGIAASHDCANGERGEHGCKELTRVRQSGSAAA